METPAKAQTNEAPRFGCPHCGSEAVSEVNKMDTLVEVQTWTPEGFPEDYGQHRDIYESMVATGYWCDECNRDFDMPAPIGEEDEEEAEEQAIAAATLAGDPVRETAPELLLCLEELLRATPASVPLGTRERARAMIARAKGQVPNA